MKSIPFLSLLVILLLLAFGCNTRKQEAGNNTQAADTLGVADSVVQYFSNGKLLKEVSFKYGVRNGLTKTYYPGGQLYQTFWYRNDLREDSSGWYFLEGQLFRSTPYKRDTIDGIQRQYYRTGKIRAKIGYSKGLRTKYFEEFMPDGKVVKTYPEIVAEIKDEYSSTGRLRINLSLSDNSTKVKFLRGEFIEGRYDTARLDVIKTTDGKGAFDLRKTTANGLPYVNIIAEITTNHGNRYLAEKKIDLPYNDLK